MPPLPEQPPVSPRAPFPGAPWGPAFQDGPGRKIFRFRYEGPERPLKAYLLERYAYGRDDAWRRGFYPHRVRLNGAPVDEATRVAPGGRIGYLHLRAEEPAPPPLGEPLYQDRWLVALHKPDSLPVSPAGIYYFTSLALLAREVLGEPGLTPVHRLDLETAGPLLLVRQPQHAAAFHRLFQAGGIHKHYRALVLGRFPPDVEQIRGHIAPDPDSAIATRLRLLPEGPGRPSLTRVVGVRHRGLFSEVELEPVTGRTNQLRVQLAALGHPIVGDKKYHPEEAVFLDWLANRDFGRLRDRLHLPRQALLCERLAFTHPFTGQPVTISAPPGAWAEKTAGLSLPPAAAPL